MAIRDERCIGGGRLLDPPWADVCTSQDYSSVVYVHDHDHASLHRFFSAYFVTYWSVDALYEARTRILFSVTVSLFTGALCGALDQLSETEHVMTWVWGRKASSREYGRWS